ncbi:MAG: ATP-grasp domain-containing protein, partial [Planctomycetes bacterium]|nr:ATP-grasp domain-containing protein [Planctomycetota bacterium]
LGDAGRAVAALRAHLARWAIQPTGIACFDCESMPLAARIAAELALPYPSARAVAACRSKYACKRAWQAGGLPCPRVGLVGSASDAVQFFNRLGRPVVLKPLTGSGSELIFLCNSADDCSSAFSTITSRLAQHPDVRMYGPGATGVDRADLRLVCAVEEFVDGEEYSCDFVIDRGRVDVIRIARKVSACVQTFGTTLAYLVPAGLPEGIALDDFRTQLSGAARTLGIERAICMLDFIVHEGKAVMIEMAPRPGGDCLPPLLLRSCGLDVLACTLDFAEGLPVTVPRPARWRRLVGLRLFAEQAGVIRNIDATALQADRRVLECHLKRRPGYRIVFPPEDYNSRILGHVIFEPSGNVAIEKECLEIAAMLDLETGMPRCSTATPS